MRKFMNPILVGLTVTRRRVGGVDTFHAVSAVSPTSAAAAAVQPPAVVVNMHAWDLRGISDAAGRAYLSPQLSIFAMKTGRSAAAEGQRGDRACQ